MKKTLFLAMLAPLAMTAFSCNREEKVSFDDVAGHYAGFITEKSSNDIVRESFIQADVTVSETRDGSTLARVEVKPSSDSPSPEPWLFLLTLSKDLAKVDISSSHLPRQAMPLERGSKSCFTSPTAKLCDENGELRLQYPGLTLVLTRLTDSNSVMLEAPASYKLSELVERSRKLSFSSRAEFQRVVQARANAQNARLNLLPHVTAGDVFGLIDPTTLGLVRMVGDLAPFLLPSRWIKAKGAGFRSQAEEDAWHLMKADGVSITEGLAYSWARDLASLAKLKDFQAPLTQLRDEIRDRERLGMMAVGSAENFTLLLNALSRDILVLQNAIDAEQGALSESVGFINPRAVSEVILDDSISVENPVSFPAPEVLLQLGLERSVELKQLDHLIGAARFDSRGHAFDWIDPSAGATPVGASMPSVFKASRANIRELLVKREEMQAQMVQRVTRAIADLDQGIQTWAIASDSARIESAHVARMLDELRLGKTVSLLDLRTSLQDSMKGELDQLTADFSYRFAVSRMNRVLFSGTYSAL